MKILQLAPVWEAVPPPGYGGTETVISVLTEELVRQGHEVLLCASGDSRTSAELFSVVPQNLRAAGLIDDPVQYGAIHVAASLRHAAGFDIVHNHNGPPFDLGMAMSHLIDTPMLSTFHNQPAPNTAFNWNAYQGWYNSISHAQARSLTPLPNAQFAGVVHNAIDVESFPFETEKSDYVLFLGRMSQEKGPHRAIEAALRAGVRIVLAGKVSAPDEREYFDACVAPLLGQPGVEYVGEADACMKRTLYADARALLMPITWEEPFGLVVIEAMACGTPAIAFPRGAVTEIIEDGTTGLLVRGVTEMAEAIAEVERIDPRCCRASVEESFSAASMADRYLAVYERMLTTKGGDADADRVYEVA